MEIEKNWKKVKKTGVERLQNLKTQPLGSFRTFNNSKVITESWYPVTKGKNIKAGRAHSFVIGQQRFVVYRSQSGSLHAMDAFCPHMGADLANGKVVGENLQCYFHQWEFDKSGDLARIPCQNKNLPKVKLQTYPVEEKYGFVWIYSAPTAPYPVPHPPGLEDHEVTGFLLTKTTLFVHHHVLMVSAIDLQHFASVHKMDIDFDFNSKDLQHDRFLWKVFGEIPRMGWRARLARTLLGSRFEYLTVFCGGSFGAINYGNSPRLAGNPKGWKLPSIYMVWGCIPRPEGVSDAYIFLVQQKATSVFQRLRNLILYGVSMVVLAVLKDDDVKAFPHMRYSPQNLIEKDRSAALLIHLLDRVKVSSWSCEN